MHFRLFYFHPHMKEKIISLLQFDFALAGSTALKRWSIAAVVFLFVFGYYDLLQDTGSGLYHHLNGFIDRNENPFAAYISAPAFKYSCYGAFAFLVFYISAFAVASYYQSIKKYGREKFQRIFIAHLLSNVVAIVIMFVVFGLLGTVAYALGFSFSSGYDLLQHGYTGLSNLIKQQIPTLIQLPYPLALLCGVIMGALPGYLAHWLGHKSRFVWYLNHRCHHTAEIMHPAGIGPFMFFPEFFSNIPSVILGAVCSKLFYYEPLIFETVFLSFVGIITEKFNHSSIYYNFAYSFKPLRWLSAYYGNGTYHYMHHSAIPGHEIINVGSGPFLFWDRVFGTYRSPLKDKPPVGLTGNPVIKLNPLAIVISGWQQLWYELKMNNSWAVRFKIIFGDIYYKPPVTKDFLIVGYTDK